MITDALAQVFEELTSSDSSAAHAVLDHLQTVAENGPEYATDEAMACEADNLIQSASQVLCALGRPTRAALALEVYELVFQATESFEVDSVGIELAYLLGAILGDQKVDWTAASWVEGPATLELFKRLFAPEHAVWQFIITDDEGGDK